MKILCSLRDHVAAPSQLTVSGIPFSSCKRCGLPMIQWHRDWIVVPKGKRLLWEGTGTARREPGADPVISSIEVGTDCRRMQRGARHV